MFPSRKYGNDKIDNGRYYTSTFQMASPWQIHTETGGAYLASTKYAPHVSMQIRHGNATLKPNINNVHFQLKESSTM
jgi:hypothetical protein